MKRLSKIALGLVFVVVQSICALLIFGRTNPEELYE